MKSQCSLPYPLHRVVFILLLTLSRPICIFSNHIIFSDLARNNSHQSVKYLLSEFKTHRNRFNPANLGVCAIFKNERRYLAEWVIYHWILGFERFFLYDNDSTDKPEEVLTPFISAGIVTLISWPSKDKNGQLIDGGFAQGRQLVHCFNNSRNDVLWMANIDIGGQLLVWLSITACIPDEINILAGLLYTTW